jgi:hypothetical protein
VLQPASGMRVSVSICTCVLKNKNLCTSKASKLWIYLACFSLHPACLILLSQHTSAYVSIRQHTSAYVSIRQLRQYLYFCTSKASKLSTILRSSSSCSRCICSLCSLSLTCIRQHTLAYVSIRQHTSAYVSIRQHTSAYAAPVPSAACRSPGRRVSVSICIFVLVKQVHLYS